MQQIMLIWINYQVLVENMNEGLNPIFIQGVNVFLNPFFEDQILFQEPSLFAST